jgi:hypothetical protein
MTKQSIRQQAEEEVDKKMDFNETIPLEARQQLIDETVKEIGKRIKPYGVIKTKLNLLEQEIILEEITKEVDKAYRHYQEEIEFYKKFSIKKLFFGAPFDIKRCSFQTYLFLKNRFLYGISFWLIDFHD